MGGSDGSGEEVSLAIRALSTNLASPDRAARLPEPISYAQTDIAIIISKSIIFVLLTASTTLEGASMSLKTLIDASSGAIAADPANGRLSFTVDGELTGPTEVALRARGHEITVDEPPALGGSDRGANPVEHALIALASCQAIAYRFWAAKLDIELEGIDVVTEGDLDLRGFLGLDDTVRAGFTGVRIKVTPVGPESPERYQELADAVDAHCPVLDLFSHETPIERRLAVPA
jgi:uncharacterized OsmC-like protein